MTLDARGRMTRVLVVACALALLLAVPVIMTGGSRPADAMMISPQAARSAAAPPHTSTEPPAPTPESTPEPTPEPTSSPRPRTGLAQAAVDAAEGSSAASTELGVAVLDRTTGEAAVGGRGTEPFYTASLAKVVVAVDMLDRRRLDGLSISDADIDLIRRALGPSDDNAMNALWTRFDGAGAASRVEQRLDLDGTTDPRDPSQWGEMSLPAADFVKVWRHILEDMPAADSDLLVSAMDAAPASARDGFNQAFGLLSPAVRGPDGPGAVAKQGWLCCFSRKYYLHSGGAVGPDRRFLVVLLTRIPRGPGWEAARAEVTEIATATVQALG